MNKIFASALVISLSGVSFAAPAALQGYGALRMPRAQDIRQIQVPVPSPSQQQNDSRWWSVDFFGSAHKAIMTAALKFVDGGECPDISRAQGILLPGANDESGHLDKTADGGPIKDIWFGNTPFSKGGVMSNYEHFKFNEAYARLGTVCHLTQDQAVPTHAANIKHGTGDSFEGYASDGNKVKIAASRDAGGMEPYAYYQDLQDDTRSHLPGWKNPATGKPYWEADAGAPPLGQDATFGPWGHYGGGSDTYSTRIQDNGTEGGGNNNQQVTASPEIRVRQLAIAGAYTVAVLRSASKRLPPLVENLSVVVEGRTASVRFTALDNRSRSLKYDLVVSRDGVQQGAAQSAEAELKTPASPDLMLSSAVSASLNLASLPAGSYTLEARLTDGDGNTTPAEVNSDDISQNDTRAAFTLTNIRKPLRR